MPQLVTIRFQITLEMIDWCNIKTK